MGCPIHHADLTSVKWFILLVLLAPTVMAFPCERAEWQSDCQAIMDSGLAEGEKMNLLGSMIQDVDGWNTNFDVNSPPEGTHLVYSDPVQNAWVRIMAVIPSVYEYGQVLSPGYGKVVSKGYYDVRTPSGTEGGDCRTDYQLSHTSRIDQYLNGAGIGGGIAPFDTGAVHMQFRADLVIDTTLRVDHYRLVRDGRRWRCLRQRTEVRRKTTIVTDTLDVERHQPALPYDFRIQNVYYGIDQIRYNASNYSWTRVNFNPQSYYEEQRLEFEPFFTLPPYYMLNFRPVRNTTSSFENVRVINDTFQVTSLSGCQILLGDYFRNYSYSCPIDFIPHRLAVSTDKERYESGELINVQVTPSIPVLLSYRDQTRQMNGFTNLVAEEGQNVIVVSTDGVEARKVIQISNPSLWKTLGSLGVLLLGAYLVWRAVLHTAEGSNGLRHL